MYLSRLWLNGRARRVRKDLSDCHALHRTLLSVFLTGDGGSPRAELGLLHRLEHRKDTPVLYVQSRVRPQWDDLPEDYLSIDWTTGRGWATTSIEPLLRSLGRGRRLRFRLRGNVTRKIGTSPKGSQAKKNGHRVPIRDHEGRLAWLQRHLERAGAGLVTSDDRPLVRLAPAPSAIGWRRTGPPITLEGVDFDGHLRVTDPAAMRTALATGIGPAKAFGFGLLSLAPAP